MLFLYWLVVMSSYISTFLTSDFNLAIFSAMLNLLHSSQYLKEPLPPLLEVDYGDADLVFDLFDAGLPRGHVL